MEERYIAFKKGHMYWVKKIDSSGKVVVEQSMKSLDSLTGKQVDIVNNKEYKKYKLR